VDQVQLDLVWAVEQREVRDESVPQCRLAGAGLAGHENVLRRALPELERQAANGAGAAERDDDVASTVAGPDFVLRRSDKRERHAHAAGVATLLADAAYGLDHLARFRRHVEGERVAVQLGVVPLEALLAPVQVEALLLQVRHLKTLRQRL